MHGTLLIRRTTGLAALAALLAALVVIVGPALSVSPSGVFVRGVAGETRLDSMCWLHRLSGLHCPMCGMLRSLIALLKGDLGASLLFHPAGPVMGGALAGATLAFLWRTRGTAMRWLEVGAAIAILTGALRWMM
jgi:hypothetical protein